MSYNTELAENNAALRAILEQAQNLPNKASGDYIPVPATASVGQTIKVSAIDDSSKPTAWEAVDFPEGGGGDTAALLYEFEVEEEVTSISDTLPFDPMEYKRLYVVLEAVSTTTNTSSVSVGFWFGGFGQWIPSWLNNKAVQHFFALIAIQISRGFSDMRIYYTSHASGFVNTTTNFSASRVAYKTTDLTKLVQIETQNKYLGVGTKFKIWGVK